MEEEIVQKLRVLLDAPIEDEYKVVYLLTQIRKVFERNPSLKPNFNALRFYCNWALHTRLSHRETVKDFLAKVDPILTLEGNHDRKAHDDFDKLFALRAFRDELRGFFELKKIRSALCDIDSYWNPFLRSYSCVVENCEIVAPEPVACPHGPLNLSVKSVSVTPVRDQTGRLDTNKPYPMDWTVSYTDGRRGLLSLSEQGLLGAGVEIY